MIAITTNNSTSVNAALVGLIESFIPIPLRLVLQIAFAINLLVKRLFCKRFIQCQRLDVLFAEIAQSILTPRGIFPLSQRLKLRFKARLSTAIASQNQLN